MTDKIGEFARSYWGVFLGALLFAAAWGTSTAQNYYLGKGQTAIAAKLDKVTGDVGAVNDKVGEVKETLAAVTVKTDDARSEIADLRRRVREVEIRR